jgi:molecular chaperone DnaK
LSDSDRRTIENAVNTLRTAMAGDDPARIRQGIQALTQAAILINEAMQRSAQGEPGAGSGGENVVDAEFEDVDDTNRRAS